MPLRMPLRRPTHPDALKVVLKEVMPLRMPLRRPTHPDALKVVLKEVMPLRMPLRRPTHPDALREVQAAHTQQQSDIERQPYMHI
jgi:hypothetical protein